MLLNHDPFLDLIEYLQSLDLRPDSIREIAMVDGVHIFGIADQKTIREVTQTLRFERWIIFDRQQRATPLLEIGDHHLPKAIEGKDLFVADETSQLAMLRRPGKDVRALLRLEVNKHALCDEECRHMFIQNGMFGTE